MTQFSTIANLRATGYGPAYYAEHQAAGLDYLGHGTWQADYGRWLAEALNLAGRPALDVGCACGSILRGLRLAGIDAFGVDLSEDMIGRGRRAWPEIAGHLHTMDAINLHLFEAGQFHFVHSAQVAEHWRPEHVPLILAELGRVTAAGGILWVCLDTAELYERQNRRPETEDPTHVCIRPRAWWKEQLAATGLWDLATAEISERLWAHPLSYLKQYDWDWFAARRRQPNADGDLG